MGETTQDVCEACGGTANVRTVLMGNGIKESVCRECVEAWADAWQGEYRDRALDALRQWPTDLRVREMPA